MRHTSQASGPKTAKLFVNINNLDFTSAAAMKVLLSTTFAIMFHVHVVGEGTNLHNLFLPQATQEIELPDSSQHVDLIVAKVYQLVIL